MLELQLDLTSDKFNRVNSTEDAQNRIKEYQHYGLTKFYISNKLNFEKFKKNFFCLIFIKNY